MGATSNGVIRDSAGNLYGTTPTAATASNAGVVYKLDTDRPRDGAVQLHGRGRWELPPAQV